MEQLLKESLRSAQQAEIFYHQFEKHDLHYENFQLVSSQSKVQSGYCLRIIRNGYLGMSSSSDLSNRTGLLQHALDTLETRCRTDICFPAHSASKELPIYDTTIDSLNSKDVALEAERILSQVKKSYSGEGQCNLFIRYGSGKVQVMNTAGCHQESPYSYYDVIPYFFYPQSYSQIGKPRTNISFTPYPLNEIDSLVEMYKQSLPEVHINTGKMPVIFAPESLFAMMWRIQSGANAQSINSKISPLANRLGEKIANSQVSIVNNPHMPGVSTSRGFDDEGVPTSVFTLIDKGILQGFFTDLEYAEKLNMKPTGHGYKWKMFSNNTINAKPVPRLNNVTIQTGTKSLREMIQGISHGILLKGVLGGHSGNILNGDFSMGFNPGLYIKNGEIQGRVKNGMVSGNVYDLLQNVVAVENMLHPSIADSMHYPALLVDSMKVSV